MHSTHFFPLVAFHLIYFVMTKFNATRPFRWKRTREASFVHTLWSILCIYFIHQLLNMLLFVRILNMSWPQGYAPPNSDRREGVLKRKRLEYVDCVSQYYDIPDTERSDDEINMLRQVNYRADWILIILYVSGMKSSNLFLRLLSIVQGLYLMSLSFSKWKFRSLWNASFIHG